MAFRFVHTADVHLDSPLKSLALRNEKLAKLVAAASRDAFAATIDLCIEETVDALLIAGDLYDGANTSMKTAAFLAAQLRRLPPDVHVFLIKGNHDAQSDITRRLDLGPSVKSFDGRGGVYEIESREGDRVAVHGVSFAQRHAPDSLLPKFKQPVAGAINIGLMHTSLDGSPDHDPYAPAALAELDSHGFDYWALGHIHKRSVNIGAATVVMPGIPQGRHINEDGLKSVTLGAATAAGVDIEERFVANVEFGRIDVDLSGVDDLEDVIAKLARAFADARAATRTPHLILRPRLTGATPGAWRFRREADYIASSAAELAEGADNVWVETVEFALAASSTDGPAVDLNAEVASVLASPGFAEEATALLEDLVRRLPRETRDSFGETETDVAAVALSLAEAGAADALARLTAPTGEPD